MADLAEVFPILVDSGTNAGESPVSRVEGEAAAAQEGLIGFSFKDASGNVILPALDATGALPVSQAAGGVCKSDYGTNVGSTSAQDIATLDESVISVTEVYDRFEILVSSLRTALWQVVYIDDANGTPAETPLFSVHTGPGAFHMCCKLECLELDTTGGTGDQNIVLRGNNLVDGSTMYGTLACRERA